MNTSLTAKPANFTRHSDSFFSKFSRQRRYHLIPLFWFLRLSDFAREGMDNSGSYRFADHMYRGIPSGKGWIGRVLDAILLKLPATRSMRQRCFAARDAMSRMFQEHLSATELGPFRLLTIPCGIPRDVRDFAQITSSNPADLERIVYTGIDLDPLVVEAAREFLDGSAVRDANLKVGNALAPHHYPAEPSHFVSSTGLGEFLNDEELAVFYGNVYDALSPGGTFFTSAAARGRGSDILLRAFEFKVHYRTKTEVERILRSLPWQGIEITHDAVGLQTFILARK